MRSLALAALLLLSLVPATTAAAPRGTLLVLATGGGGQSRLYAVDAASGQARILASGRGWSDAAWAPDGRHVALVQNDRAVVVFNADGSGRTVLPAHFGAPGRSLTTPVAFAWGPDSRTLAVVEGQGQLLVLRGIDGAEKRELVRDRTLDTSLLEPSWSPDGRWIGFERIDEGGAHSTASYRLVRATGGADARLFTTHDGGIHDTPTVTWSPDSKLLGFVTDARSPADPPLAVVTVARRSVHRILGAAVHGSLDLAARGQLAVVELAGRSRKVVVARTSGHVVRRIGGVAGAEAVRWSPDAAWLAVATTGGRAGVVLVPASGGAPRTLLRLPHGWSAGPPLWRHS